jgi:aspartate carbamoyltransferase catalytic subunit
VAVRHVVEVSQFDRAEVERLFEVADRMRTLPPGAAPLKGRILATIFYEPSTRTRLSFESAMIRLGGNVLSTENAREFSSAIKGESVEDTIRIVEGYADAIVIRHYEQGAARRAADVASVPVINGGDGPGEHPTQALLDLYTIRHELGRIDGLRVALVGDLRFGRAVRSLALLFRLTTGTELIFVSPPAVPMGADVRQALDAHGIAYVDESNLAKVLPVVDVVYQTRIQRERFATPTEYEASRGVYVIDAESMRLLNPNAIVLHPLPRVDEISPEVDSDPRAAYFRQAHNGVYLRMALLSSLLTDPSERIAEPGPSFGRAGMLTPSPPTPRHDMLAHPRIG